MSRRAEEPASGFGYFLRFAGAALFLVGATLVLVLVVLPQRYVLSAGFRESSLNFPTPTTPFTPPADVPVPARRLALSTPAAEAGATAVEPVGPAQRLWNEVVPRIDRGRFAEALPLFEAYLDRYPTDHDARREYAVTLVRAGRPDDAVAVQRDLLAATDASDVRLLLARTLRDLGRVDEASEQYQALSRRAPADVGLTLEWARALSAATRYDPAGSVLLDALGRHPAEDRLRVELARVHYYAGHLSDAEGLLARVSDAELDALGARTLRDDVAAALAMPEGPAPEAAPPSLLERAMAARERDDFATADRLYEEAIAADPRDPGVREAYADFLQYERSDFGGAHEALVAAQSLTGPTRDLQVRLARLEIWLDRPAQAEERLLAVLAAPGETPTRPAPAVSRPDVHTMLGDLYRWDGRRRAAAVHYQFALAARPDHEQALDGMAQLRLDVFRGTVESQRPRVGVTASSLSDTDGFERREAGVEWSGVADAWTWDVRAGARSVHGIDLLGVSATDRGAFADTEVGRWWRWGTVRTAVRVGVEDLRAEGPRLLLGASLRYAQPGGRSTDVSLTREPAYTRTNTLQSVRGDLLEHRFTVSHTRPVGDRWSVAASVEGAALDAAGMSDADAGVRWQGSLSVGRTVTPSVTLGLSTGATGFTRPAPRAGGSRLYWDPNSALSFGPYARLDHALDERWRVRGSLQTGVARLQERSPFDASLVPHLSAEAGLTREGARYRAAVDGFYLQGRFDGYRAYGLTLSFGARTGGVRKTAR